MYFVYLSACIISIRIFICTVSEGVVIWAIDQLILQTTLVPHTCNPVGHGHRLTVTVKKEVDNKHDIRFSQEVLSIVFDRTALRQLPPRQ